MLPIEILQKKLKSDEAAIIIKPENRRYYTGMNTSNGLVLVTPENLYFFTDFRYITAAKKYIPSVIKSELFKKSPAETVKDYLSDTGCKKILFEENYITYSQMINYREKLGEYEFINGDGSISGLRIVKSKDELNFIGQAQKITDDAFLYIINYISSGWKKGITEKDIALELEFKMRKSGSGNLPFSIIIASGENSALPHAVPTDKKICEGDFITMDFGATVNDYASDMTRTIAVDHVSDKQEKIYNIVKTAQDKALDYIKAGVTGVSADAAARDYIKSQGYGDYFGHSLGHGVGLNIHETPNFSMSYAGFIPENSVMSVEPGIYIEGEFGVRIEDLVTVKSYGVENFTKSRKDLIILK
jgi:Xaa-Pro aminopeptidase